MELQGESLHVCNKSEEHLYLFVAHHDYVVVPTLSGLRPPCIPTESGLTAINRGALKFTRKVKYYDKDYILVFQYVRTN